MKTKIKVNNEPAFRRELSEKVCWQAKPEYDHNCHGTYYTDIQTGEFYLIDNSSYNPFHDVDTVISVDALIDWKSRTLGISTPEWDNYLKLIEKDDAQSFELAVSFIETKIIDEVEVSATFPH
ncbi:MAG: hypothetical protein AB4063_22515 [Crocosphaera sp.]